MEGKPGILIILVILDILLILAAVAFGVFFAIKQALVFDVNVYNLYAAIGCGGMFILTSVGIIIARNARIAADNTYDILRHIELLIKKEGISLADLARRDQKDAIKTEKKINKMKKKKNDEVAIREISAETEQNLSSDNSLDTLLGGAPAANPAPTNPALAPDDAPAAPVASTVPNCGLDYTEWKQNLEGKVVCGEDGQPMVVRNTKKGVVIIICQNALSGTCSQKKALPVDQFAAQFLQWYEAFNGEHLSQFSFEIFNSSIQNVTITNLEAKFVANV